MKLLTYDIGTGPRAGVLDGSDIVDATTLLGATNTLRDVRALLEFAPTAVEQLQGALRRVPAPRVALADVKLRAPILQPPTIRDHIAFLAPIMAEWFSMWWFQEFDCTLGAKDPRQQEQPKEIAWALEHVKEQMLIRRDVKKDDEPPSEQKLVAPELGNPIGIAPVTFSALVPKTEWIETALPDMPPPTVPPVAREAYLQWRTLVDSLEER